MRYALISLLTLTMALAACGGGDDDETKDIQSFLQTLFTQRINGQGGRTYDTLHPDQQALFTREQWIACEEGTQTDGDVKVKVIETYPEAVEPPGLTGKRDSLAVTYEASVGDEKVRDTGHFFLIDGKYRWVTADDPEDIKKGIC